MSRQAFSCAVLLLVVTLSSRAADTKPDPAATSDSWAPLGPMPAAAPAVEPRALPVDQSALTKAEKKKRTVPLNGPAEGYHDVKLKNGGVIRVSDEAKLPDSSDSGNGKYDPQNANFSRSSSYAHKGFSASDANLSKSYSGSDQKPYATSAYNTSAYSDGSHTFKTSAYRGTKGSDDFSKTYALPNPADYNKTFATKGSDLQSKNSNITKTTSTSSDPFSKPWSDANKRFYDPIVLHVPHHEFTLSKSIRNDPNSDTITDIPNRPLTVDEVRNLLNHGQVPDTNSRPGASSPALNDPNWAPPLKLPDISDRAAPATPPPDETRDNELPSPGMMAQPRSGK